MATLQATDIADLVAGTLRELGRMKFQQIAQNLRRYEVMSKWLKGDRITFDEGIGIQRTLMTKTIGAARHTGLFNTDDVNIGDVMKQLQIGWVHADASWGFDRRELLMNRGASRIFDIVKGRRVGAMIDLAELLEIAAWSAPTVAQTELPFGVPYWIVKNATQGFNGGLPQDHTTLAGINLTDVPTFKNWTDVYSAFSKGDAVKKLRKAHRKVGFMSPIDVDDYRKGTGKEQRLYVNDDTIDAIEDIGEAQNDNLGRDIAPFDGTAMTFRRHPIVNLPVLNDDSQNPIYMIDHSTFSPVVLKGNFLEESKPEKAANSHNSFEVFVDLSYNFLCVDRRRNAVLYQS